MKRIIVFPEFWVRMIEHIRERDSDLVEKVIPNSMRQNAAAKSQKLGNTCMLQDGNQVDPS